MHVRSYLLYFSFSPLILPLSADDLSDGKTSPARTSRNGSHSGFSLSQKWPAANSSAAPALLWKQEPCSLFDEMISKNESELQQFSSCQSVLPYRTVNLGAFERILLRCKPNILFVEVFFAHVLETRSGDVQSWHFHRRLLYSTRWNFITYSGYSPIHAAWNCRNSYRRT